MAVPLAEANTTVSAAVRRILLQNGNKAMRLSAVFEEVKPLFPELSRTHFREKVVRQMFDRGEVSPAPWVARGRRWPREARDQRRRRCGLPGT